MGKSCTPRRGAEVLLFRFEVRTALAQSRPLLPHFTQQVTQAAKRIPAVSAPLEGIGPRVISHLDTWPFVSSEFSAAPR